MAKQASFTEAEKEKLLNDVESAKEAVNLLERLSDNIESTKETVDLFKEIGKGFLLAVYLMTGGFIVFHFLNLVRVIPAAILNKNPLIPVSFFVCYMLSSFLFGICMAYILTKENDKRFLLTIIFTLIIILLSYMYVFLGR